MSQFDADVLIVGAGLAGAATAWHLRRMSDRRVVLLEKEDLPGVHSSGRNAAFVREFGGDEALQNILSEGAAFLRRGELAAYNPCGSVLVGLGNDDVGQYFPIARGRGKWCPEDGTVDVAGLLQAYLAGQDVRYGTEVRSWTATKASAEPSCRGEPVRDPHCSQSSGTRTSSSATGVVRDVAGLRVETSRGTLTCAVLVNAAGPWAGAVGKLPLTPMRRHLYVTRPDAAIDPRWPFVWDVKNGLYFRPESGGLLLSACDESAGEPGDYTQDPAVLESLAEKVERLQPGLGALEIQNQWAGQRTFAPDRRFVIGWAPREPRLFHVAGLGGHGVTASWAVGKRAAEMLLGQGSEGFSPGRLAFA